MNTERALRDRVLAVAKELPADAVVALLDDRRLPDASPWAAYGSDDHRRYEREAALLDELAESGSGHKLAYRVLFRTRTWRDAQTIKSYLEDLERAP